MSKYERPCVVRMMHASVGFEYGVWCRMGLVLWAGYLAVRGRDDDHDRSEWDDASDCEYKVMSGKVGDVVSRQEEVRYVDEMKDGGGDGGSFWMKRRID